MGRALEYDLQGQKFGKWTVLERVPAKSGWLCICQCGTQKVVYGGSLRAGLSSSCGCHMRAELSKRRIDLTGRRVGKLLVIRQTAPGRWHCKCDCGNEIEVLHRALRKEERKSCGCLKTPDDKSLHKSHHQLYGTWAGMVARCHNPKHRSFSLYGQRGIVVCDEWRNSFEQFVADMGERPFGKTLDRIDVNGPYGPTNCRWLSLQEQSRNKRKQARIEEFSEEELLAELARRKRR